MRVISHPACQDVIPISATRFVWTLEMQSTRSASSSTSRVEKEREWHWGGNSKSQAQSVQLKSLLLKLSRKRVSYLTTVVLSLSRTIEASLDHLGSPSFGPCTHTRSCTLMHICVHIYVGSNSRPLSYRNTYVHSYLHSHGWMLTCRYTHSLQVCPPRPGLPSPPYQYVP